DQFAVGTLPAASAHGEEVIQDGFAAGATERGGEDERAVDVGARPVVLPLEGDDLAVAAPVPIEKAAEDAARVEAGHAAPVDGRVLGDQGRGVAVPDEGVVADGRVAPAGVHPG